MSLKTQNDDTEEEKDGFMDVEMILTRSNVDGISNANSGVINAFNVLHKQMRMLRGLISNAKKPTMLG